MKANRTFSWPNFLIVAFSVVVLFFSVRSNSLWIDEGQTFAVISTTWRNMIHAILKNGNAISGMPLYFLCEFWWCKIFGYSEFALRSMNFICAIFVLWGSRKIINNMKLPIWSLVLFVLNPVFLYYMNEARPYAAIYACGLWCIYFLCKLIDNINVKDLFLFLICFWIGCALHMMFIFMAVVYACLVLWHFYHGSLKIIDHLLVWLCLLPLFMLLAIHYMHVVFNAPEVNSSNAKPLASILQIGYYFAGFGGLGWSRNDLRSMNLAISWRIIVELAMMIISYIAILGCFLKHKLFKHIKIILIFLCFVSALSCFIIANIILKTRFWERHIIYLIPCIILILASVLSDSLAKHDSWAMKIIIGVFIAMNLLSGFNIIAMNYYQKDNYRDAITLAKSFNPKHIFFQGDSLTFNYYGIKGVNAWSVLDNTPMLDDYINISTATEPLLEFLLNRTKGDTVLILNEKHDFDTGLLYKNLASKGTCVNSFSVIFIPSSEQRN
ncbi:MAG: glycosyltransferase family 39 protein [Victivallales bacterium]|nr:glycosyltransferase family 39 protein [Victivallales bacterium]